MLCPPKDSCLQFMLSNFLGKKARLPAEDYKFLQDALPFGDGGNTALGVAVLALMQVGH